MVDLNNWFKPFTNLQRAFKTQAERTTLADKTMASQAGEKAPEGEEDWKKGLKAPKKDDRVQTEVRRVEHRRRPPALVDEIAGRRAGSRLGCKRRDKKRRPSFSAASPCRMSRRGFGPLPPVAGAAARSSFSAGRVESFS